MMEDEKCDIRGVHDESTSKSRKSVTNSRKKSLTDDGTRTKDKGEKRTKKRKGSDSNKKPKKEDGGDAKVTNLNRLSSDTPDSELRLDQSDSPITDDVFEGSNSSQESNELLSMSSLLKSVLDRKKKLLLESDEIQQFFTTHMIKKEH
ncbi:uncharacterized protein LOC113208294 [Frankliniella occidentalis]|uniref:Uncharacterized protein LOC113208294 n=1 Tax=Frankliniella occidentalis TaxID=133901 RepID=A0A6J1SIG1_FRAOC|nr:uncharacterized protein LOC113208294 [Frankliniella occidentalis]XP_026281024.1 uncharacterized protein LOC113208294 [Frankliniella occidentalis]XP_052126103.1 uncharacterized protein LOC113208294 [Frankliniella occidentalis]XP_052126104.1 uncharacterized protein LOC113208294 [Frankliniella occidentalis]